MFTALLSAIPALSGLLKGGQNAGSSFAAALQDCYDLTKRVTSQRNAALVAVPIAFVAGVVIGRRSK